MKCIKNRVRKEVERGCIGSDLSCPYHPSHFIGQDCTFCYCPFYPCRDPLLGKSIVSKRGGDIWDCSDCLFIHRTEAVEFIMKEIRDRGFDNCDDGVMKEILEETKKRFWRKGKALMVLGATSDAGKSITVTALCRILQRKGMLVVPFKSQNMSLNSKVTRTGSEIAMIQALQAQAAGLKNTNHHMNPILMKPKGDTTSQVIVHGKPFGDYDVESYYREFVPGPGIKAVRESLDFLKNRYDAVIMEGAGSPAEINIYDYDIANMKAAEAADADCILVVNAEWGGSFAYALGTVELIPEEDRKRIKGIVINNVRGDPEKMKSGVKELEELTGIPVIGIISHADVRLPAEDSNSFRISCEACDGKITVAVVKFPRISNFSDFDPLLLEDVSIRFVETPEGLDDADAVILPGTKNTISDLNWMKDNGIALKLESIKGKIPIMGICGGYQMMGKLLSDPDGVEGIPSEAEGLGFFDDVTVWKKGTDVLRRADGKILSRGGDVSGYETHEGITEVKENPLFGFKTFNGDFMEGSVRENELLLGTYLHGVFDSVDFRNYFLSFIENAGQGSGIDYYEFLDENIDRLADVFENALDMDAIMKLTEAD